MWKWGSLLSQNVTNKQMCLVQFNMSGLSYLLRNLKKISNIKSFGYRKYRNIKRQRMKITKRKMYLTIYIVKGKENY